MMSGLRGVAWAEEGHAATSPPTGICLLDELLDSFLHMQISPLAFVTAHSKVYVKIFQ